ncbi:MAG: helix-turn-helix transcriptional regulator [Pseudomonadota bacterium]
MSEMGTFGALLREWRQHRRMSQLALATEANVSQRHVSFLESGRSNPSPVTVACLADALSIPLRERNVMLRTAGFAPRYAEDELGAGIDPAFMQALEAVLTHHEPFPAMVLDGRWNQVMANAAALRFFSLFIDIEAATAAQAGTDYQIARLCLDDRWLKPYITNWEVVVESLLRRARLALVANPRDEGLAGFIDEVIAHPEAPAAWRAPARSTPPDPVLTMDMARDGRTWRLFTMLAHFGNPQSVTLQELSVETFFPADESTRVLFEELAAAG